MGIPLTDVTVSVINPAGTVLTWNSTNAQPGSTIKVRVIHTFTAATLLYPLDGLNLGNSAEMMIAR